jgi:hypothetical protein
MFETPAVIIMTIAATRMHRSLVNFASVSSDVYDALHFLSFYPLRAADVVLGHMIIPN